jgi:hypothetical protein
VSYYSQLQLRLIAAAALALIFLLPRPLPLLSQAPFCPQTSELQALE